VLRLLVTFGLAAALAAGCGDDEKEGRTVTLKAGSEVRVVGDEYSFDPETVVYDSGGSRTEISIELENRGALAHNLKVFDGERELGGTPTFQGGETKSGAVELNAGEYRMVCTVGNHEELGMTGTLEVR
jgi:plastocyanin